MFSALLLDPCRGGGDVQLLPGPSGLREAREGPRPRKDCGGNQQRRILMYKMDSQQECVCV